ncbi:serine/threonine-protein kinase [Streptomyces sp. 549]|uniref:serine/threonine-protein kinase n=1 Tax=Streptomyces sp. 549 TaxID=3049076 RepID=UPI0024C30D0E|nr:serine/threonine-protein kinase [Streptomyces sp. 549]MDK1475980.1 serine/threonine-protein kinase [Streptomyces sp. 549]
MRGRLVAGRYELAEQLGKGAMGQVWGGHDRGLGGRPVAVKLMHPGRVASMAGLSDSSPADELRERFERECRVTAQIDHPGLVTVFDAGQDDRELFLVMQRVDGTDLSDHLAAHRPYPMRWAVSVAAQLCSALAAVHSARIVHRDLKPGNIMVRPDGRVVVVDLGIAAVGSVGDTSRLTRTGALIGTPVYMAPEQALGGTPVGPAADLYALGVVLYELLAGRPPFTAPEPAGLLYMKLHEQPDPIAVLRPETPVPLAALVHALMDKDVAARPADAHEVHAALAPLLPSPVGRSGPELPMDPTRPFREPLAPWPPRRPARSPAPGPLPWPPPLAGPAGYGPPPGVPPRPYPGASSPPSLPGKLAQVRRLLEAGQYTQVADLLGQALPAAIAEHGEGSPVVRTLRRQYASTLVDTGQYARALPEISRLLQELAAELGPYDPSVLQLREDEAFCRARLAGR